MSRGNRLALQTRSAFFIDLKLMIAVFKFLRINVSLTKTFILVKII